jgi:hypothetical protein
VDGDGYDDVVISSEVQGTNVEHLRVLRNNRDGTFSVLRDLDQKEPGPDINAADVTLADVDGDGYPDIVAGSGTGGVIDLYWGDATASYASRTELTLAAPESVAVADFDGDGLADLAALSAQAEVVVLRNTGSRTFSALPPVPVTSHWSPQIRAADLSGDGKPDLVVPASASGMVVLLGNGDGTFAAPVTYSSPGAGNAFSLRLVDMNLDGKLDVLSNGDQVGAVLWYGVGDGTFASPTKVPAGGNLPQGAEALDLNGDLLPDLAVLSNSAAAGRGLSVMLQTY